VAKKTFEIPLQLETLLQLDLIETTLQDAYRQGMFISYLLQLARTDQSLSLSLALS